MYHYNIHRLFMQKQVYNITMIKELVKDITGHIKTRTLIINIRQRMFKGGGRLLNMECHLTNSLIMNFYFPKKQNHLSWFQNSRSLKIIIQ